MGDSLKRASIRIVIAFFGALFALVGVLQPASAEPAAALPGNAAPVKMDMAASAATWLMNLNSGKCALSQGGADGQPVVQYQCLNYNDQRWSLVDKGSSRFQLRNANSGKCLLVRGTGNEAPAVQFQCLNYVDQYWEFYNYPGYPGWYWLQNVNSRKCLIVRGGSDGTQLVQFDCAQYIDQAWGRVI
ncbi:hypothetical protein GCM10022267_15470 [Lentzea roselyniae]|uniref:Ricin B lectin domain-containing protein n=1 Tax=Lentzea roselyniae TaxID=531940 RepID=A0ABP7ACV9_9PSEU